MKPPLHELAARFFDYLGRHFPQQCASDEFYFFPRSEAALPYLDRLDDLSEGKIQDHICAVRKLLRELPQEDMEDLEQEIDRRLLIQGMESFTREYEEVRIWQKDPTLYVKIPLFALAHILSENRKASKKNRPELLSILGQIPPFLIQALRNLHLVPEISLQVGAGMARDALLFHKVDIKAFIKQPCGGDRELTEKNREAMEAWQHFQQGLEQSAGGRPFAVGEQGFHQIIQQSLSYGKSPEEILDMARDAFERIKGRVKRLEKESGGAKFKYRRVFPGDFLALYREEVQSLRRFFASRKILSFPEGEKVMVLQTPSYLESLRATASYKAPLTGSGQGYGVFYVKQGEEDPSIIAGHCPYLSAHETYPGHHMLDHLRLNHPNPIRRQTESPLFYEGWACYGEQLLDELGYIRNPAQQLIQLRRQLWRSLRAILDVEIHCGNKSLKEAAGDIERLGYSADRAWRQIRRFSLTPGYQLCYFVGTWEILRLRSEFSGRLGLKGFHDVLLEGGQIPFDLAKKRLTFYADRK